MQSALPSQPHGPLRCGVCAGLLGDDAYRSLILGRTLCPSCAAVEHQGWKLFGVGGLCLLLLVLSGKLASGWGIVSRSISAICSPVWILVWFGICFGRSYRHLRKRELAYRDEVQNTRHMCDHSIGTVNHGAPDKAAVNHAEDHS